MDTVPGTEMHRSGFGRDGTSTCIESTSTNAETVGEGYVGACRNFVQSVGGNELPVG
jgi:hypothetical protein